MAQMPLFLIEQSGDMLWSHELFTNPDYFRLLRLSLRTDMRYMNNPDGSTNYSVAPQNGAEVAANTGLIYKRIKDALAANGVNFRDQFWILPVGIGNPTGNGSSGIPGYFPCCVGLSRHEADRAMVREYLDSNGNIVAAANRTVQPEDWHPDCSHGIIANRTIVEDFVEAIAAELAANGSPGNGFGVGITSEAHPSDGLLTGFKADFEPDNDGWITRYLKEHRFDCREPLTRIDGSMTAREWYESRVSYTGGAMPAYDYNVSVRHPNNDQWISLMFCMSTLGHLNASRHAIVRPIRKVFPEWRTWEYGVFTASRAYPVRFRPSTTGIYHHFDSAFWFTFQAPETSYLEWYANGSGPNWGTPENWAPFYGLSPTDPDLQSKVSLALWKENLRNMYLAKPNNPPCPVVTLTSPLSNGPMTAADLAELIAYGVTDCGVQAVHFFMPFNGGTINDAHDYLKQLIDDVREMVGGASDI